jgi:transposase
MNQDKQAKRQAIIQLHKKGKKQTEISYLLDVPQQTVSYWIIRYKQTGNLEDKKKTGTKPKLSKENFQELKTTLLDFPPSRYGGESIGWLTKMAIDYVKKTYNVTYSMRRMQEIFHDFGLNLITPRLEHKKSSYAARTVYRMDFKKNSKKNI